MSSHSSEKCVKKYGKSMLFSQFFCFHSNSLQMIFLCKQILSLSSEDSLGKNGSKRHHNVIPEIAAQRGMLNSFLKAEKHDKGD